MKRAIRFCEETLKLDITDFTAYHEKILSLQELDRASISMEVTAELLKLMRSDAHNYMAVASDYAAAGLNEEPWMNVLMENLPRKTTITMRDFSWYMMTLPGEPYHDLAARFKEAVDRDYNTFCICAMPFMLFTADGKRPGPLKFGNLGAVGQRTRWYNCRGGAVLNGHVHLLELFRQAKKHGCYIILSSWEYQQSPSFLAHTDTVIIKLRC